MPPICLHEPIPIDFGQIVIAVLIRVGETATVDASAAL
jgi:hypothetical protein